MQERFANRPTRQRLQLQAGLFQVEVALDAVHDLVPDAALVTHADEPLALRHEQLDHEALVVRRAFFDTVGIAVEAGSEAVAAVGVEAAHTLLRVLAHPVLLTELSQALQGGLRDLDAAVGLLLLPDAVVFEAEGPNQGRQREALDHQSRQDHAERQEDYEVAAGELPARRLKRQREGCGQGDHTPHPSPGYDRDGPPRRRGISLPEATADPPWNVGRREDPYYAHDDDRQAYQDRIRDKLKCRVLVETFDHAPELKPYQDEDQSVQQERYELPRGESLKSRPRGGYVRALAPEIQPRRHHRENPGEV